MERGLTRPSLILNMHFGSFQFMCLMLASCIGYWFSLPLPARPHHLSSIMIKPDKACVWRTTRIGIYAILMKWPDWYHETVSKKIKGSTNPIQYWYPLVCPFLFPVSFLSTIRLPFAFLCPCHTSSRGVCRFEKQRIKASIAEVSSFNNVALLCYHVIPFQQCLCLQLTRQIDSACSDPYRSKIHLHLWFFRLCRKTRRLAVHSCWLEQAWQLDRL